MPDRVVVAGEDEESDHSAGEEGGEAGEAHVAQPESAQALGLPAGGSAPLGKVPLTQIQLKLAARLELLDRRVKTAGKAKNEKALKELRSSVDALRRATQHVAVTKQTLDGAFAELSSTIAARAERAERAER